MSTTSNPLYTVDTLADRIKAKYPEYADLDNVQLVSKVVAKHPEYQSVMHPSEAGRIALSNQPGAMQSKPGGPIFTPQEPTSLGQDLVSGARDTALSAASTVVPNPTTSATQNLKNIGTGMNEQVNKAATTPWAQGGPLYGTFAMLANGIMNALHGSATGVEKLGTGVMTHNPELATSGGGEFLGNLAQSGAMAKTPEAISDPIGRESMQNVMNMGPAKANFIDRQVGKAQAVQATIKPALDALHADGKNLMANVSSHIDSVKPEGAFDKAEVAGTIKDAMGVVKDETKVPPAIRKLTTAEPSTKTSGPSVGGKPLDLKDPQQLKAYQKMKGSGAFTPEEIQKFEGGGEGKMTFEALKQLHSDLGRQIAGANGPVEAGVKASYAKISDMLRKEAESHGLLDQWTEGAQKVKLFNDIAYRSPLKDTYAGANHGQIMKPLISDDLGPQVKPMLERISPYGIDMDKLNQTISGYKYGERMDTLSEPSRMTPILAAISPKMAAMRIALPQAMRGEGMTTHLYGQGLESVPKVSPKKVFPSKLAAAQELKGSPALFGDVE